MKVDFKSKYKNLYQPPADTFTIVDVPEFSFLSIEGEGNPNTSEEFSKATQALYSISYFIKMSPKKGIKLEGYYDYSVGPLEGLWFAEDMTVFTKSSKDEWKWKLLIIQPEFVNQEVFRFAVKEVSKKKPNASLEKVKFEKWTEGLAIQIMYYGSYSNEGPVIERMHQHILDSGYELAGFHHEIYLGDFRKVAPEKLKTILRQQIRKKQ